MAGLAAMMPNEDIRDNFHQLIREVSGQHVKRVRSVLEVFFFFFFFWNVARAGMGSLHNLTGW
jgi:hypothetical protein